jgi:hypothetical protein
VLWLLVYDSDFGTLPLFDEMLMIPSHPSSDRMFSSIGLDRILVLHSHHHRSLCIKVSTEYETGEEVVRLL